jgi:hypothetical protein
MSKMVSFSWLCSSILYFLQHPLLHVGISEATTWASAFSVQQFAPHSFAFSEQQSHAHFSHEQTPDSQQQPPSGQQLSQAQTLEAVAGPEVLA